MSNEEKLNETEELEKAPEAAEQTPETPAEAEPSEEASEAPEASEEKSEEAEAPAEQASEEAETPAEEKPAADETPEKAETKESEQKPAKPAKAPKQKKTATGMSKMFKLIYFPVLALVVMLLLIFSVADGVYGYKPGKADADFYAAVKSHITAIGSAPRSATAAGGTAGARDYITSTLKAGGFTSVAEVKDGEDDDSKDAVITTVTEWANTGVAPEPTVTVMTAQPTPEIQNKIGEGGVYVVGADITNIIAAIPSRLSRSGETSSAVIVTVRYDSRTDTPGATDNAAFVATVMQTLINYVKSNTVFENDLVVVFTEDLDRSYGSHVFMNSFKGLKDVVSRAVCGINLDAIGNYGTLALTDSSGASVSYLNAYTKISGNTFNSSVVEPTIPDAFKQSYAVEAFKDADIPALQVSVLGGTETAQSYLDSVENVSDGILRQQATFVKAYADKFCMTNKTFGKAADKPLTVFSYFDWGTVSYNAVASYVIGGLLLALIAGTIVALALKKTFSIKKLFTAMGAELLVVVTSLVAMYVMYFLVTLMLTGFGAMPLHAITQIRHFNTGILIAGMITAVASAFGATTLFKKVFKVTSSDVVRGTAMLFGITGAVMSFAVPALSYLTVWLGMLLVGTLLLTTLLNGKLKERFGFGFDRLFVFVIPVALCLPLVMAAISAVTELLPLITFPLVMTLFVAMLGVAVPYLDRTTAIFDRLAKKLPKRTVRVERTVTERVEDRAKKGKFTERTVKKVVKEKVAVNYKTYFGVATLAVVAIITALFAGGFGISFGKTLTDPHTYDNAVYNDAIVYEWEKDGSGKITQNIVVDDLVAYKFVRYAVTDLVWDSVKERYFKTVNYNSSDIVVNEPKISVDGNKYTFTTFDGSYSTVSITIPDAQSISSIKVSNSRGVEYKYEFSNVPKITLKLPYAFGNSFTLEVGGDKLSTVEYEEHESVTAGSSNNQLVNLYEWNQMIQHYAGTEVETNLRGGIVLKATLSA